MEVSQPVKKPAKRRKTNWIRGWVQLFFFVLIAFISINHTLAEQGKGIAFLSSAFLFSLFLLLSFGSRPLLTVQSRMPRAAFPAPSGLWLKAAPFLWEGHPVRHPTCRSNAAWLSWCARLSAGYRPAVYPPSSAAGN